MTQTTPSTSAQGPVAPTTPTPRDEAVRRELVQTLEKWKARMCAGELAEIILSSPAMRASLTASPSPAASPASPSGVRVKPLEWKMHPEDGSLTREGLGAQRDYVERALHPWGAYFLMVKDGRFSIKSTLDPFAEEPDFDEPELARAAAQADYEARILSALASEATPAPTSGSEDGAMSERTIHWVGTEDEQFTERLKACKARRKQYGQSSCCEKDGSCDECEDDMARALRDTPERRKKLGIPLTAVIDYDAL